MTRTMIVAIAGLCSAATAGVTLVAETTWGGSDLDGWTFTPNGFGEWVNPGSGGNPGGYAQYIDVAGTEPPPQLFAPAAFLGDYTGYLGGFFQYDVRLDQAPDEPGEPTNYPRIRLLGADGSEARAALNVDLTTDWQQVTISIVESDWEMLSGTWAGLIGNVESLYFGGDMLLGGGPEGAVDNFRLYIPAPGAAFVLGGAGLAMARRRR
jgi:hypothetical protein